MRTRALTVAPLAVGTGPAQLQFCCRIDADAKFPHQSSFRAPRLRDPHWEGLLISLRQQGFTHMPTLLYKSQFLRDPLFFFFFAATVADVVGRLPI